jgi:hypothetical protein
VKATGRGIKPTDSFCAETVQSCYRKAVGKSKRLIVPELCHCEMVYNNIIDYIPRIGTSYSDAPVPLGEAQKYAKLFLKHLPKAKTTVMEWARWNGDFNEDNPQFERLVEIEVAQDAVTKLLDRLARPNPKPFSESDFARWIAAWGMEGWQQAGGEVPKSVNFSRRSAAHFSRRPADPLCIFVTEIFRALGRPATSVATVSDWLRHRDRHRKRTG